MGQTVGGKSPWVGSLAIILDILGFRIRGTRVTKFRSSFSNTFSFKNDNLVTWFITFSFDRNRLYKIFDSFDRHKKIKITFMIFGRRRNAVYITIMRESWRANILFYGVPVACTMSPQIIQLKFVLRKYRKEYEKKIRNFHPSKSGYSIGSGN